MIRLLAVITVTELRLAGAEPIGRIAVVQLFHLEREPDQKPVAAAVNQFHIVVATKRPDGLGVEIDLDIARRRWLAIHDRSVSQVCLIYAEYGGLRLTVAWQCPIVAFGPNHAPIGTALSESSTRDQPHGSPVIGSQHNLRRAERKAGRTRMALHESIETATIPEARPTRSATTRTKRYEARKSMVNKWDEQIH